MNGQGVDIVEENKKRPTWWKMFASQRAAIESIPDTSAGAGIKAAFRYFDGEEVTADSMDPLAYTAFCLIKPFIVKSIEDVEKSRDSGKKGAEARWGAEKE